MTAKFGPIFNMNLFRCGSCLDASASPIASTVANVMLGALTQKSLRKGIIQ
jgi:hypothetical protein